MRFTIPRLTRTKPVNFWRAPIWKWLVFAVLLAASALLLRWEQRVLSPPPPKVEFLLTQYPVPTWDGSYPVLVIDVKAAKADRPTFSAAISMRKPSVRHEGPVDRFEVDLSTGMFVLRKTDLFVPDVMPLVLTRTYTPWDYHSRAFGVGTNHPYDICPTGPRYPYSSMDLNLEDRKQIHFDRISNGTGYADDVEEHHATFSEFYGARIWWNGNGWTLHFPDGRVHLFPEAYAQNYAQGAATEMQDGRSHAIQLQRDRHRNLERLVSPSGHAINFTYDHADRVIEAWDDAGSFRRYSYNASGHMETVSDWSHLLYRFEYARQLRSRGYDPYLMTAIMDGDWHVLLRSAYESGGRVSEQTLANGDVYKYDYVIDSKGNVLTVTVTLPNGQKRKFYFEKGMLVRHE